MPPSQIQLLLNSYVAGAGGGGGGPSIVQNGGGASVESQPSATKAFPSNVVSGNKLVIGVMAYSQAINATGVTDTQGNTYTKIAEAVSISPGGGSVAFFMATAGSSGANTVTYTGTGGNNYFVMGILELSSGALFDAASAGDSGTSTTPDTGAITTTSTDIIFGMICQATTTMTITEPSGYTLIYEQEDGDTFMAGSLAYKVSVASGSINPSWTLGSSAGWAGFGIGLK